MARGKLDKAVLEKLPRFLDISHWKPHERAVKVHYTPGQYILAEIIGFTVRPNESFLATLLLKADSYFPSGTSHAHYPMGDTKGTYQFLFEPADVTRMLTPPKEIDFVSNDEAEGAKATPVPGGRSEPAAGTKPVSAVRAAGLRHDTKAASGKTDGDVSQSEG